MRIIIKAILKTILKLLVILIPTIYFLVATQLGLKVDLKLARLFLPGKLEVTHVKGALLNTFDIEKLNYYDQSITISMKNLSFSWSLLKSLYSKITIEKIKIDDLNVKLAKQPLNKNKPNTNTPIKLETYLKPLQSLKFTIKDISINNLHIQYEKRKVTFHNTQLISESTGDKFYLNKFITKANSSIISSTGTIDYNKKFQSQLLITTSGPISSTTKLKGDLNNYQLNTDVFSPFKLHLTGKINNNLTFNTSLVSDYLYWPIKSKEIIATHSKFVISGTPKHVKLKGDAKIEINKQKPLPFSIMAAVNENKQNNKLLLHFGDNHVLLQGKNQYQVDVKLSNLAQISKKLRKVHTSIYAKGVIGGNSNVQLIINPGYIRLPKRQSLTFKRSTIIFNLAKNLLTANGNINFDNSKNINLRFSVPVKNNLLFELDKLQASMKLAFDDISIIDKFIEDISHTKGKLRGYIKLKGGIKSPKVISKISLTNGQTTIDVLEAHPQKINVELKGYNNKFSLTGHAKSGSGSINLSGQATISNEHFYTELKVKGKNFKLYNTDEYKIDINPNIAIKGTNNQFYLTGSITIPRAKLTPHDFSSSVQLDDDVIILGRKKQRSKSLQLGYHADLILGKDVNIAVMGLTGKLTGQLTIDAPFNKSSQGTGTIRLLDGKYNAYGQHLDVTQGKFLFTGSPLNNPGIIIQASRSFEYQSQYSPSPSQSFDSSQLMSNDFSSKMTVGLHITGRLKSPKIRLFSNPNTQNQADILSMLILGRPASQANNDNDSQLLLSALSTLDLGGGASGQQLTSQLQHTLGLDSLGIETQSIYDAETDTVSESSALVIGKSISSKLSLNYSIGFGGGSNILRVKYSLNPNWTIQTESDGSANGIDVIYNYQKK